LKFQIFFVLEDVLATELENFRVQDFTVKVGNGKDLKRGV